MKLAFPPMLMLSYPIDYMISVHVDMFRLMKASIGPEASLASNFNGHQLTITVPPS
jgi:hypothetical protein